MRRVLYHICYYAGPVCIDSGWMRNARFCLAASDARVLVLARPESLLESTDVTWRTKMKRILPTDPPIPEHHRPRGQAGSERRSIVSHEHVVLTYTMRAGRATGERTAR